ncbi:hypothetical protein WCD91_14480 [Enterobacter cloacae]|jgi:hypothetical protein|uniref:hypothetical protein n=1 Tax=Bacteria TaxID=2 RepID=UPI000798CDF4|nr:hypothetical protein [Actinomyces sp.]CZY39643.1 Uncharacterised protein [Enterobacter cloacae]HEG1769085.1 hypothetical protein [Enterobacter asburiae]MDU5232343.1 hypothetical protein [Actinomyces sp.]HAS1202117.1 hypothetical protein [Enterobacter cloacae]HAS1442249.1 hypothetical protein [Enterobacter cloacae]
MTNKTKELVAAGHALAKELHCAESAALVRELATQLDVQLSRSNALAAENAGLKAAISSIHQELCGQGFEVAGWHLNGDLQPLDSWFEENNWNPETPATDAFLAEVRAQGLERLAKAWYAIANETAPGISISESSRLKYRQRADDVADFANEIRKEAAQ